MRVTIYSTVSSRVLAVKLDLITPGYTLHPTECISLDAVEFMRIYRIV